jgi:bisphosphoglycerate-dependent phosphoglycerate mutase
MPITLNDFNDITLKVNGKVLKIDIDKEFSVSQESLERTPAKYGYLVALQYKLLKAVNKARRAKEEYYSNQFLLIKEDYDGSRPPSDEATKQEILTDKKYKPLLEAYQEADANYSMVTGLIEAYRSRIDILRTLSANRRKELDSES